METVKATAEYITGNIYPPTAQGGNSAPEISGALANVEADVAAPEPVDFLILGAGWSSQWMIPLLKHEKVSFAATTTDGRDGTIPFRFDPDSIDLSPFQSLPAAKTVLVVFPLKGSGPSKLLTDHYRRVRGVDPFWIQLGSTSIYTAADWRDHDSLYDKLNERGVAEDELLGLGGCVLNLAGLYGGGREPKNWVTRIAKTKQEVKERKAVHLVHGVDVARAVYGAHLAKDRLASKRWIVTDLRIYDWWDLIASWGLEAEKRVRRGEDLRVSKEEGENLAYQQWILELMEEEGVRGLPRSPEELGRKLDSRAFWTEVGLYPTMGRVN